jgi:lipoyl(octanoyl) transferase
VPENRGEGAFGGRDIQAQGMNPWLFLNSGKCEAAFNMALDEALLEGEVRLQKPVLRVYGWMEPAATFGYFQKYSSVERATLLRPLVRRPTGGGIVPHDVDWTYSFAVPPGHEWHSLAAIESYRRIHEWIQRAFARLNIPTELAPEKKTARAEGGSDVPGECFTGHEKFDLLWHGKKIAGAAQRRNKMGLLIQGSLQPPPVRVSRSDWEKSMRETATEQFSAEWEDFSDEDLLKRAEELARKKYSQVAYSQKS